MAHITPREVDHLAMLSHISFSKDERASLKKDLDGILAYVEKLQAIPGLSGALQFALRGSESQARDDEEAQTLALADEVLESVPAKNGRWVKGPKIRRT